MLNVVMTLQQRCGNVLITSESEVVTTSETDFGTTLIFDRTRTLWQRQERRCDNVVTTSLCCWVWLAHTPKAESHKPLDHPVSTSGQVPYQKLKNSYYRLSWANVLDNYLRRIFFEIHLVLAQKVQLLLPQHPSFLLHCLLLKIVSKNTKVLGKIK